MSTIAEKLQQLQNIKDDFKEKINAKGGSITDTTPFSEYPSQVDGLSGGGEDMLQARVNAQGNCYYLFNKYPAKSLDYIKNLDLSKITNISYMILSCPNLTTIPLFDTSNVTNMEYAFGMNPNLTTIPLFDTSNVTNMSFMLENCSSLTTIPQLDTSKVTNMNSMFSGCKALTTIPLLDTSKVITMGALFSNCSSLTVVPALDVSNVTNSYGLNSTFNGCTKLKSILMYGMKVNFDISASTQFEREDLVTILNNLGTVPSTKTLTMGATNLAKLTDDDKAIATNKGWTLA